MTHVCRLGEVADLLQRERLLVSTDGADLGTLLADVADDSRAVPAGALFCAWEGASADGHAHLAEAVRAGAVAALVERPSPEAGVPQLVVTDGRRAAAVAATRLLGDPQAALTLVGTTGTNGKTTSVWVLRHLLAAGGPAASIGTLGTIGPAGDVLPGSEALTTPGPVQLAHMLRRLVDSGARYLAMEVSSHALDQGRVAGLRFAAAVFTNLTRDHLDYHGSLERYRAAKVSLLDLLQADGVAVLNADERAWDGLAEAAPRALTFGRAEGADLRVEDVRLDAAGTSMRLATSAAIAPARVPLLGSFNVENAAAAVAACLALGLDLADTTGLLARVPPVPGRLERIASEPCTVLRDYAHTPDALERALAAVRAFTRGRLIVVFGAGGDRDRGKRPLMGRVAALGADVAIVTSDNPRTEDPAAIIADIMAGMDAGRAVRIVDRRAAIAHALTQAGPADVVLLAGKGHETYQVVGSERRPFDERQIVGELLGTGTPQVKA